MTDTFRTLCEKVLRYNNGEAPYNFSQLNEYDRDNAAYDAWQEIRAELKSALADGKVVEPPAAGEVGDMTPPEFPPVLLLLPHEYCQCEFVWSTPEEASKWCKEWKLDPQGLPGFRFEAAIGDDRANYLPDNDEGAYLMKHLEMYCDIDPDSGLVFQWNGDAESCTPVEPPW